jgi:hypothetical protein
MNLRRRTSRARQPAITSLVESEPDPPMPPHFTLGRNEEYRCADLNPACRTAERVHEDILVWRNSRGGRDSIHNRITTCDSDVEFKGRDFAELRFLPDPHILGWESSPDSFHHIRVPVADGNNLLLSPSFSLVAPIMRNAIPDSNPNNNMPNKPRH